MPPVHCGTFLAEVLLLIQKHYFPVPCTLFRLSHSVLQQALGTVCKAHNLLYKMNPKNCFFPRGEEAVGPSVSSTFWICLDESWCSPSYNRVWRPVHRSCYTHDFCYELYVHVGCFHFMLMSITITVFLLSCSSGFFLTCLLICETQLFGSKLSSSPPFIFFSDFFLTHSSHYSCRSWVAEGSKQEYRIYERICDKTISEFALTVCSFSCHF